VRAGHPDAGDRRRLNVDLDANGDVVGFDIDLASGVGRRASGKLDLSRIETIALPPVSAAE
jgi:hypothetical protein